MCWTIWRRCRRRTPSGSRSCSRTWKRLRRSGGSWPPRRRSRRNSSPSSTGERDSLSQQLEQAQQALAASQDREEAQERELAALRQERDSLKDKVAALEPEAAAYEAVKERTAGVELEAHCRAQNILDQANGQAKDLRRSMEQWMGRVEREYDALRSEVESTVSHAADQLEKANKCLDRMTALLSDQDVALEALSQAYDNTDPEKVPAPVPLNED